MGAACTAGNDKHDGHAEFSWVYDDIPPGIVASSKAEGPSTQLFSESCPEGDHCVVDADLLPQTTRGIAQGVDRGAVPALIQRLNEKDPRVRQNALVGLGQHCLRGDPQGIMAACQCLGDSDQRVRVAAAEAIGQICHRDERAIATVFKYWQDADANAKQAILRALGLICLQGDERIVRACTMSITDVDWRVRGAATEALGRAGQRGDEYIKTAVEGCLSDNDADVRLAAVKAVGELSLQDSQPALSQVGMRLQDSNWRVRQAAVETMSRLCKKGNLSSDQGDQSGMLGMMSRRLQDKDPDVRLSAVLALSETHGAATVSFEDEDVDKANVAADSRRCAALLRRGLEDADMNVKLATIRVLSQFAQEQNNIESWFLGADGLESNEENTRNKGDDMAMPAEESSPLQELARMDQRIDYVGVSGLALCENAIDQEWEAPTVVGPGTYNRTMHQSTDIVKLAQEGHECGDSGCAACPGLRRAFVLAMGQACAMGDKRAIATLQQRLKDNNPGVRQAAVEGIFHVFPRRSKHAIDALVERLNDADVHVRLAAVVGLGAVCRKGDPEVLEALDRCACDANKLVRLAAITALGQMWPKGAGDMGFQLQMRLRQEEDPETKRALLIALVQVAQRGDEPVIESAISCSDHKDWRVRASAVAALGYLCEVGDYAGISASRARLKDDDADVRVAAVVVLGRISAIGNSRVMQGLRERLKDPCWRVRCVGIEALSAVGNRGDGRVLALIGQRLVDKEAEVRLTATQVLTSWGDIGSSPCRATRLCKDGRRIYAI